MASTYTPNGIEKPTTGEQSGAWGDTANTDFELIEEMASGVATIALADADATLTMTDGASAGIRHKVVLFTGTLTTTRTLTVAATDAQQMWVMKNSTGQSIIIKQGSGAATVTIANGDLALVYCDGSDEVHQVILNADSIGTGTLKHEQGGLEIDASAFSGLLKITGGTSSAVAAPTGAVVGTTDTQTLAAKTMTSPVLNGTLSGTAFLDQDDMSSDSAIAAASQQSVKAYVDAAASMPKGHIFGGILVPGTDAANDINSTAIECRDAADTTDMTLAAFVKQIDANWATGTGNGGFPSGLTLTDETWYHFFIVSKTGDATFDAGFDTSLTASNLLSDTGGTLYRRIGSVWRRVSSNGNKGFTMFADGKVMYDYGGEDGLDFANTALSTSARETVTLTSPAGIKLEAIVRATFQAQGGAANKGVLTSLEMDDITASGAGNNMTDAANNTANSQSAARINVWTNTSSQIGFRMDTNASMDGYATCIGYYDDRGRNS